MSMKNIFHSMVVTAVAGVVTVAVAAAPTFGQLVDNLDARKNTKLHTQQYWKTVKGQEVTWSGDVHDVDGGSSKAKIYVADKSRPLYKGYNIIVVTTDVAKALTIKRGQRIRFKGVLDDFDRKDAGAVIELKQASIL